MDYSTYYKLMEIQQKGTAFILPLLSLAVSVFTLICMWKVFEKMGEQGWISLVPIYNSFTLYKRIWGCGWYSFIPLLAFIPIIGPLAVFVATIKFNIDLARSFDKSWAFGVGLTLLSPVFFAILAFSDVTFTKPTDEQQNPLYGVDLNQNTQKSYNDEQITQVNIQGVHNDVQQENVNFTDANNVPSSVSEKEMNKNKTNETITNDITIK